LLTALKAAGKGGSLSTEYATQDEIASITGGHAFYSTNGLLDALTQATEMGADYYTVTYAPSDQNFDGGLRRIRVALSQKGYHLEYRRAYYATESPQSGPSDLPTTPVATSTIRPVGDSLSANMQYGAPTARQVLFRIHVQATGPVAWGTPQQMANLADQPAYFRIRRKYRLTKPLPAIQLQTYLVEYTVIGRQPNLEVAAAAFDSNGVMLNGDVENATSLNPQNSSNPQTSSKVSGGTYYRIQQRIDVPVGAASVRLAVRDVSTDRIGAMEIPLPLSPEPAPTSRPVSTSAGFDAKAK
jgi:hypothetical protein